MKKMISLIKVSLSHDMNIFKINTKKQGKFLKVVLPFILTAYIVFVMLLYSGMLMDTLKPLHLEFVVLTLFTLSISFISLIEGVYKSGTLLFNCKDDNLLLSLPIKKNTVLFIRIFKFYVFELLYNSLFILPSMVIYAVNVVPGWTYYLSSFVALLVLPIFPILLSCIIGFVISFLSSKFKGKNIVQTVFSMFCILIIMYLSFNIQGYVVDIAKKASSLNDLITRLYYPVGAYISLVNDFNVKTLVIYIIIHLFIALVTVFILGQIYFKVNSGYKGVMTSHKNSNYVIKSSSKMVAFVKKELHKFFLTPVFVTNAGFGLVIYIIACIFCSIRFDTVLNSINSVDPKMSVDYIKNLFPIIMFGLICFTSFMTSITSSMISLEGKSFSILKSLPLKPLEIVLYKVMTSLVIMVPCIIVGDIIIFINFKFDIISILLLLIASILCPLISSLVGIIINLKYPKVDATNDTEVVKQSMSSFVSVLFGMGFLGLTSISLFKMVNFGINNNIILFSFIVFYGIVCLVLYLILMKTCDRNFNNISV